MCIKNSNEKTIIYIMINYLAYHFLVVIFWSLILLLVTYSLTN